MPLFFMTGLTIVFTLQAKQPHTEGMPYGHCEAALRANPGSLASLAPAPKKIEWISTPGAYPLSRLWQRSMTETQTAKDTVRLMLSLMHWKHANKNHNPLAKLLIQQTEGNLKAALHSSRKVDFPMALRLAVVDHLRLFPMKTKFVPPALVAWLLGENPDAATPPIRLAQAISALVSVAQRSGHDEVQFVAGEKSELLKGLMLAGRRSQKVVSMVPPGADPFSPLLAHFVDLFEFKVATPAEIYQEADLKSSFVFPIDLMTPEQIIHHLNESYVAEAEARITENQWPFHQYIFWGNRSLDGFIPEWLEEAWVVPSHSLKERVRIFYPIPDRIHRP